MKLAVVYACGHTRDEERFGGKYDEQVRRAKHRDCPDCYHAAQHARNLAAIGPLAANLPAMLGSERHRQWAEQVRAAALARLVEDARSVARLGKDPVTGWEVRDPAAYLSRLASEGSSDLPLVRALRALLKVTDAGWWIDRRDAGPKAMLRDALGERA